jgi:hypothetical protein
LSRLNIVVPAQVKDAQFFKVLHFDLPRLSNGVRR